jgi:DNA-binding beta-propeller fold protein YncE
MTASETSIWVTIRDERLLVEIDAQTNEVVREIPLADDACTVAWADGSVWLGMYQDLIQHIDRLDPATGEVIGTIDFLLASSIWAMDAGPGGLWVLNRQRMEVYRVDTATTEIADTFNVGYGASDMEVTDEAIWVTSDVSGGIQRIDPESGESTMAEVDVPMGVAVDEQGLWAYIPVHDQLTLMNPKTFEQMLALRFKNKTGEPETASGAIWMPTTDGLLLVIHSKTGTPGAVYSIPEGIETAKEAVGDIWLYGNVAGLIRIEPDDVRPASEA